MHYIVASMLFDKNIESIRIEFQKIAGKWIIYLAVLAFFIMAIHDLGQLFFLNLKEKNHNKVALYFSLFLICCYLLFSIIKGM